MSSPERKTELRRDADGRAPHDVGGLDFGVIDRHDHDLALWEKRTDAMLILLVGTKKNVFKIDAMRRVIEAMPVQRVEIKRPSLEDIFIDVVLSTAPGATTGAAMNNRFDPDYRQRLKNQVKEAAQ